MEQFRHVGIMARAGSAKVVETLEYLIPFLQRHGMNVVLDTDVAPLIRPQGLQEASRNMLGEICDLIIVVGGDGSLLGAARTLAKFNKPVLGINRGRLGFLTDVSPEHIDEKVGAVLRGEYHTETRFLLECSLKSDGAQIDHGLALNDVVFHTGKSTHMVEFELFIEGQFVYRQRSDGLIVATPTGSTAYALSGGGPIMHPRLDAIVLVPMHPHTLTSRPIVVDGNSEIKIQVLSESISPMVSCDGQTGETLRAGDWIYIRKYPHKLKLIHPSEHDFYQTCRTKLGWSSHQVNES